MAPKVGSSSAKPKSTPTKSTSKPAPKKPTNSAKSKPAPSSATSGKKAAPKKETKKSEANPSLGERAKELQGHYDRFKDSVNKAKDLGLKGKKFEKFQKGFEKFDKGVDKAKGTVNKFKRLQDLVKNPGKVLGQGAKDFIDKLPGKRSYDALSKALKSKSPADIKAAFDNIKKDGSLAKKGLDKAKSSKLAKKVAGSRAGQAGKRIAQNAAKKAASSAAKSGLKTAAKSGARTLARAGGRFVPGANVAIAAYDAKRFYDTLKDPNASTGKKITSGITALGSAAAATNIPVVSQVGAGVSAVSDFVGGFF